jgi:hypothetical protein
MFSIKIIENNINWDKLEKSKHKQNKFKTWKTDKFEVNKSKNKCKVEYIDGWRIRFGWSWYDKKEW